MATAPDYLANLEAKPGMKHFLLADSSPRSLLWMLSGLQQAAFAEEVLAHPGLLRPVSREAIVRLYQTCRVGSPDTALEVLGKWAQMHSDAEPQFRLDMHERNCMDYYVAADLLTRQRPSHLDLLDRDYLVLPDGGCCLPVAYILAAGHWRKGHTEEWIDKLTSHLKDGKVKGDRRVGWLLARAWVEEIRYAAMKDHCFPIHDFLVGRDWLEEACLTAQSEAVRLRAYKELAVRLAAEEQFETAHKQLEKAASRCSSVASVRNLAAWQQEIDQMAKSCSLMHKSHETAAQQAYWNEMRDRYRRAVHAGDQAEVSRYKLALSEAGVAL